MTAPAHRIKLEFTVTSIGAHFIEYIALDEATLCKAQFWKESQQTPPTDEEFAYWICGNGGKPDRDDGPAVIITHSDGSRYEAWYREGQLDRADGPAVIETWNDGIRVEKWYSKGEFIKEVETSDLSDTSGERRIPVTIRYHGSPPRNGAPEHVKNFMTMKLNEVAAILATNDTVLDHSSITGDNYDAQATVPVSKMNSLIRDLKPQLFVVYANPPAGAPGHEMCP